MLLPETISLERMITHAGTGKSLEKARLLRLLARCWSAHTSTGWSLENPARGQCGVTALAVHAEFGGVILKTPVQGEFHYYNSIDNEIYDFTESQFDHPIVYHHLESSPDEVMADISRQQYIEFSERLSGLLSNWMKSG